MQVVLFTEPDGSEPVIDYVRASIRSGDAVVAAAYERIVDLLERRGPVLGMPHSRLVNRQERLYEARFGPHRVAYIVHEDQIVLLHGWRKRSQKLDEREEARALRRADRWRAR